MKIIWALGVALPCLAAGAFFWQPSAYSASPPAYPSPSLLYAAPVPAYSSPSVRPMVPAALVTIPSAQQLNAMNPRALAVEQIKVMQQIQRQQAAMLQVQTKMLQTMHYLPGGGAGPLP
jgi:hypothetical protein